MKLSWLVLLIPGLGGSVALAEEDCMNPAALIQLDSEWERSLLELDEEWLQVHLMDTFTWVHSGASLVDTKDSLLARVEEARSRISSTRSRIQSGVEARVVESTGVVTGFTVVDRGSSPTRYHFMRTYVAVADRCSLLANHTMIAPEDDGSGGG